MNKNSLNTFFMIIKLAVTLKIPMKKVVKDYPLTLPSYFVEIQI